MGHPLSLDLRERVVAVVDGGLSRRQAAARFSVSPTSAIRWCQRKASGNLAPARQGGDRRSHHIEAHADFILAEVAAAPDVTLEELRTKLIDARDARFGLTYSTSHKRLEKNCGEEKLLARCQLHLGPKAADRLR